MSAPAKVSVKITASAGGGFGLGSAVALVGAAMLAVLALQFFRVHTDVGVILASLLAVGVFVLLPFCVFRALWTMPPKEGENDTGLKIVAGLCGGWVMLWFWWWAFMFLMDWHAAAPRGDALAAIPLSVMAWWAVNNLSLWVEGVLGLSWPPPKA